MVKRIRKSLSGNSYQIFRKEAVHGFDRNKKRN